MKYLVIVATLSLFVLSFGPAHAQDKPRLAKVITVEAIDGSVERQFFGRVTAKETVDLAFQVAGQIVEFPAIEGQPIPAGSLIAQLDLEPFQLSLDQARAQKTQADRNLARFAQLRGSTVSQVSVDDARTQTELADIAVRNAERSLRQATLESPFTALVASRNVANFSTIGVGTPIVRIHDMSELRIEIDVPEIVFQAAGENPDVDLKAEFPAIDGSFDLEIREFNAETSSVGQTFRITFGMQPPNGQVILPGSSVTVHAVVKGDEPIITIPLSAVLTDNTGTAQAMVFEPTGADEGTVQRIPIEIVPTQTGHVEVVSGLSDGQEIIASGGALLADGETVRRFSGFSR